MSAVTKATQNKSANKVARVELMSRLQEVRSSWTRSECKARQQIALSMQNQLLHRLGKKDNWPR